MGNVKHSIEEMIGNTPLFEPVAYEKSKNLKARLLLKVESVNPLGSLKDRIAAAMLDALEANTDIKPGDYVVELSSGNTVIALAALARKRGYHVLALMGQVTEERIGILEAYGAKELAEAFLAELAQKDGNRYFLT